MNAASSGARPLVVFPLLVVSIVIIIILTWGYCLFSILTNNAADFIDHFTMVAPYKRPTLRPRKTQTKCVLSIQKHRPSRRPPSMSCHPQMYCWRIGRH